MTEAQRSAARFEGVLLDADNTLLDFDRAERAALLETFGRGASGRSAAQLLDGFHAINARLWRRFEAGLIDQPSLRLERFRLLAEELGLHGDPQLLAARYVEILKTKAYLRPHALAVLRRLRAAPAGHAPRAGLRLALLSNGIPSVQRARLARAGIGGFFDAILISGEIGLAKPDRRFFDLAVERLGLPRERLLCVGDSPSSDIRGGHLAGLATCWYAYPPGAYPPEEPPPDYRIADLRQLPLLLAGR